MDHNDDPVRNDPASEESDSEGEVVSKREPGTLDYHQCVEYAIWVKNLKEVEERLAKGEQWWNPAICEIFRGMGMWFCWLTLCLELQEEDMDWDDWKQYMVGQWIKRFPDEMPAKF